MGRDAVCHGRGPLRAGGLHRLTDHLQLSVSVHRKRNLITGIKIERVEDGQSRKRWGQSRSLILSWRARGISSWAAGARSGATTSIAIAGRAHDAMGFP